MVFYCLHYAERGVISTKIFFTAEIVGTFLADLRHTTKPVAHRLKITDLAFSITRRKVTMHKVGLKRGRKVFKTTF